MQEWGRTTGSLHCKTRDEPLVGRSAAPTDRDATMTIALSSTVPASSRALARVHSRIGTTMGVMTIGRASGTCGHASKIRNERVDPQADALSIGGQRNASQCPVVTQNRFSALSEARGSSCPHGAHHSGSGCRRHRVCGLAQVILAQALKKFFLLSRKRSNFVFSFASS